METLVYRLGQAEVRIKELTAREQALEDKIEARERERDEEERKKLKAGIGALVAIIMTLGGIVWTFRSVILSGRAP